MATPAGRTSEICYYLDMRHPAFDFDLLAAQRDGMDKKKRKHSQKISLGGKEFLLRAGGSVSGYPFVLSNPDAIIQFGEFNAPSFFVKFSSEALWHKGLERLHKEFLDWAAGLNLLPLKKESISRVDFCFDYRLSEIDFSEDFFVSRFEKDNKYRGNRKPQTFVFGTGTLLRVYNKSTEIAEKKNKEWFFDIWQCRENVWRIEWQVRKELLRQCGIVSLETLALHRGLLLDYLANDHTTLRFPTEDSNRSRWPLHPLWVDHQKRVKDFGIQTPAPLRADFDKIPQKIQQNLISVMGYVKNIIALHCLHEGIAPLSFQHSLRNVSDGLWSLYTPLTWEDDIQNKIDKLRLQHD